MTNGPATAPTSMLGEELAHLFSSGYVTAAIICTLCWSITPLSWLVVIYATIARSGWALTPSHWLLRRLWQAAVAYSCLEVPFSLYLVSLKRRIAPIPARQRPFDRELIQTLFARSLSAGMSDEEAEKQADEAISFGLEHRLAYDDPRAVDFRQQMTRWFLEADFAEVKRDNMLEWLAWALCGGADLEQLRTERDEEAEALLEYLETALELVEARAGHSFPPGRSPHVKCIRLQLDPVVVSSKPLILYALVAALSSSTVIKARRAGFVKAREGDIEYLLRLPSTWNAKQALHDSSHRPLVVLHGLGIGLGQYISVIEALARMPELQHRPVIVLRQPWISMRIWHHRFLKPPGRVEMAASLKNALIKHGMADCGIDVLSHSNGTIIHGWLIKTAPELIQRSIFVDPVCFCLFEPDVPFQFVYRVPRTGIELLMRYFVASEIGHAHLLQRHFQWTDNLLWAEEVQVEPSVRSPDSRSPGFKAPNRVLTVLSGQDAIVPVHRVKKYLRANGMQDSTGSEKAEGGIYVDEAASHGQALMTDCASFERIFRWLAE